MLIGFVTSRGLGFAGGDDFAVDDFSGAAPARAIDAAVGAVSELRLDFLEGAFFADRLVESDVLELTVGDLTELDAALADGFVDTAAGLPFVMDFLPAFDAVGFIYDLKSSATGGRAPPPLTASSLTGSADFILPGSASAPVIGLSGFSGALSNFAARGLSSCPS